MEWKINTHAQGKPLHHHWSECIGAGRAAETLRSDWREQLKVAQKACGYRRIRFHGLLHDDMFLLHLQKDGSYYFNWQYVDAVFDHLVEQGIEPFVELGFCPGAIARERGTVFWWNANGAPPADKETWCKLIDGLARHCLDRYGPGVLNWYWEVWNEPNHNCFFKGSRQEYFELYADTVKVIKAIDSSLKVGGPATANFVPDDRFVPESEDISLHSNHKVPDDKQDDLQWQGVWIKEFLTYCEQEKVPVDFISFHPYPMDWASDGQGGMKNYFRGLTALKADLSWARGVLASSAFPNAEIHCTEWNTSSALTDLVHDELATATYAVATNIMAANIADSVSWWTFTDIFEEQGGKASCFHGGFGQINSQGLPKPLFHGYRFMNQLGKQIIQEKTSGVVTGNGAHEISVLIWNYPEECRGGLPMVYESRELTAKTLDVGQPESHHLHIQGLSPNQALVIEYLDREHGSVVDAWRKWGSPEVPSQEQIQLLQHMAQPQLQFIMADEHGCLELDIELQAWALAQIRTVKNGSPSLEFMPVSATQPMDV